MSTLIKHEGVWKEPKTIYVKDQGVWKDPDMIYVKDQGVWKEVGGPKLPPFGEPLEGGFYFGNITVGSDEYALIIADKAAESLLQWKTSNTSTSGTSGLTDGWANTNAMNNASHPAAKYCRDYRGGGFDDWYLPARSELDLFWFNIGPERPNTPSAFKSGGPQALESSIISYYWSSTEISPEGTLVQKFDNGLTLISSKTNTNLVRPIRRVNIYDL